MKTLKTTGLMLVSIVAFTACVSVTKEKNDEAATAETCHYQYQDKSLDFTWTAYKFTTKTGVKGTFDDIKVITTNDAKSLDDLLNSVKFTIRTGSVNSNEPQRDLKIDQFFFGTMANTKEIKGALKEVSGNKATVAITLNEITADLPGAITLSGDTITLTATVDFKAFDGAAAVKMLNQVCSEKHTGEDGKSVFWDVVDITVKALYRKTCI